MLFLSSLREWDAEVLHNVLYRRRAMPDGLLLNCEKERGRVTTWKLSWMG